MMLARWVLSVFAVLILLLLAVRFTPRPGGAGAAPRGVPAPLREEWLGPPRTVATVPPSRLGRGEVLDIAERDGEVYLLQFASWTRAGSDGVVGPIGDPRAGSPRWIASAAGIAAAGSRVYVLDAARRRISVWDREGAPRGSVPLGSITAPEMLQPAAVAVDSAGSIHVSALVLARDGAGEWLILRFTPGGSTPDTVYRRSTATTPGDGFATPHFALAADGSLVVARATDYALHWFAPGGVARRKGKRADPPLWPIPDTIRRRYAETEARFPASLRQLFRLPDHFPPVRDIALLPHGRIAVLLTAADEALDLEVLDSTGVPLGRLTDRPLSTPAFLAGTALYQIVETIEGSTIVRRALQIPG
jgi:hypothetical protein